MSLWKGCCTTTSDMNQVTLIMWPHESIYLKSINENQGLRCSCVLPASLVWFPSCSPQFTTLTHPSQSHTPPQCTHSINRPWSPRPLPTSADPFESRNSEACVWWKWLIWRQAGGIWGWRWGNEGRCWSWRGWGSVRALLFWWCPACPPSPLVSFIRSV